jgi:chromosome segregation ATPase
MQATYSIVQGLKRTQLDLQSLECKLRMRDDKLAQSEESAAGLQRQLEALHVEKATLAEHVDQHKAQIQQLNHEMKEAAMRAQEEISQKCKELYEAQHATDKSNVRFQQDFPSCLQYLY